MTRRLAPWVGGLLIAGSLVLQATATALYVINKVPTHSPEWGVLDHLLFALAQLYRLGFAVVGGIVVARRPSHPIGWLFCGAALALSFGEVHWQYADFVQTTGGLVLLGKRILLAHADLANFGKGLAQNLVLGLLILGLLLLFPNGRLPSRKWRPFAWLALLIGTASLTRIARMMWPTSGDRIEIPGLDVLEYQLSIYGNKTEIVGMLSIINLGIAGWSLVSRYRAGTAEERQQIRWFALAGSALGLMLPLWLILFFSGVTTNSPAWSSGVAISYYAVLLLLPIATAIAIFKYRLYDIDLVIRRTLTFGSLALFITIAYVGVVVGASRLMGAGEQNLGLSLFATGMVAIAFQPAQERAKRLANRLVYGEHAEPYEILASFARHVGKTLPAEQTLPLMAEAAARGVRARAAKVRLFLPDGNEVSESWPSNLETVHVSDENGLMIKEKVVHLGKLVGEIQVIKLRGDDISPSEGRLLKDLASQAGLALHRLRLTVELQNRLAQIRRQAEELEASQRRIMTAELWTRLKLERELHERVGRLVVASGELLGEAERSFGDVTVSERLLDQAAQEAKSALEEMRELARGVFPTLLAEEGIVTALKAQLRRVDSPVRLHLEGDIGGERFDPHSESAVYYCCAEVVKHLSRSPGDPPLEIDLITADENVKFSIRSGELTFRKTLPDPLLREMADRVEALGGTLEVRQGSTGTVLVGEVPSFPPIDQD